MTIRAALVQNGMAGGVLRDADWLRATLGPATLFAARGTPCSVTARAALIGWAFRRDGFRPCATLGEDDAHRIAESAGAWAIRNLWGNYLLFWADGRDRVHLLRSPVTGPPLFQLDAAPSGNGDAGAAGGCAFTDLALARALGFALDRPDPRAVDAYLRYPLLRTRRAGIEGVAEILPGEIARLGEARTSADSWSPWDHALAPPRRVDAAELGDMVGSVTRAWSSRFGRIQLELSGGIDSSIVAACLAGRGAPWRAVTMVTAEPDGDERIYARAVAVRSGVSLFELLLPSEPADPIAPPPRVDVRPGGFGLIAPTDAAFLRTAQDYRAEAIFSGTGGDGAFGYQTTIAPAIDALRFAGWRAAFGAARDQARITDDTIWSALGHGLRAWLRDIRMWPVDDSLLSRRHAGERPAHPWIDDAARIVPGQRRYGLGLLAIQPFLDGYARAHVLPKIAPLMSQPLIEFGLGVPSWQWGEGGLNRALARAAFRGDLPDLVLSRRSKGRILSMFLPAFENGRERLSAFLLDGWLAGEGLLDCDAIDALLSGRRQADSLEMLRILHFADIENWARAIVGKSAIG